MGNNFSSLSWVKTRADRNEQPQAPENPAASGATELPRQIQKESHLVHRTSRYLRESIMRSYIFYWARRSGLKEVEATLHQQQETSNQKVLTDHMQWLDGRKKDIDNIKAAHRTERGSTTLAAKRQTDGARMAARKFQVALEQERQGMDKKLKAVKHRHKEEKKQIRVEYEDRLRCLQGKLDQPVAPEVQDRLMNPEWAAVRQGYEAELEDLRGHVNDLEEKLQSVEAELKMKQMELQTKAQKLAAYQNEHTVTENQPQVTRVINQEYGPQQFMEQHMELQRLKAQNAKQSALIKGLHFSLSNLDPARQLDDSRAVAAYALSLEPPRPSAAIRNIQNQTSPQEHIVSAPSTSTPTHSQTWHTSPAGVGFQQALPHMLCPANQSSTNAHGKSNSTPAASPCYELPLSKWYLDGVNRIFVGKDPEGKTRITSIHDQDPDGNDPSGK
ncbi:MAG: hypothetical protein Q9201_002637 [Fulgogasparrea decipioides]